MTTEIGEEIFGTNSTLFETLDALDVSDLPVRLDTLNARVTQVNAELVQLSRVVDDNQARTNEQLAILSTNMENLDAQMVSLTTLVNSFDERIEGLTTGLTAVINSVTNLTLRVNSLDSLVVALDSRVDNLDGEVNLLNLGLSALKGRVDANQDRLVVVENQLAATDLRVITNTLNIANHWRLVQPLMVGINYNFLQQSNQAAYGISWQTGSGDFIRMGYQYTGTFAGTANRQIRLMFRFNDLPGHVSARNTVMKSGIPIWLEVLDGSTIVRRENGFIISLAV